MITEEKHKLSRSDVYLEIKNIIFMIVGCLILGFSDAVFSNGCNLVTGGVSSVGVIVNYYVYSATGFDCTSLVVTGMQVILWVVGWFTLGKKFSINTLLASALYPAFFTLFYNFHVGNLLGFSELYAGANSTTNVNYGMLILAGFFGGATAGIGVAICYLGNGSTGGFDIISFIIAKYTEMKEDVSGFICDATLVLLGWVCMGDPLRSLIGILSALTCAVAVQYIYINADSFVIVDVISEKYMDIQDYIHKELGHATTLIDIVGGYSGEKHKMIRVVIYEFETTELKNRIAQIDPLAFVSFMQAKTINGRGFVPFVASRSKANKRKSRFAHLGQYENGGSSESFIDPTPETKEKVSPPDNATPALPDQGTNVSPNKKANTPSDKGAK
jgi:uncharacterized membrane-anchored protein YitT (DUF2179 family)